VSQAQETPPSPLSAALSLALGQETDWDHICVDCRTKRLAVAYSNHRAVQIFLPAGLARPASDAASAKRSPNRIVGRGNVCPDFSTARTL